MVKSIVGLFLIWRVALFLIAILAVASIPQFGGRFPYSDQVLKVTGLPSWIWGFGNFDGVHYLRIAQNGYSAEYSQAFFPLYPVIIHFFTNVFLPKNQASYFFAGLILSNIFFILGMILFYKLLRLDVNQRKAFNALILLVSFPTSFYFGSIYTESLFLLLVVATFYFTRKKNFIIAGICAGLASATRIFGLILVPALLAELYLKIKNKEIKLNVRELINPVAGIALAPVGTLLYMFYLKLSFNNPLYFLTSQPIFGAERTSGSLILLPQVFFRYLKIFITVPVNSLSFFNAILEFSFTIIILTILIVTFRKIRLSYFIFILGCLLLPTLTGTLSSMPRYSLMGFLLLPTILPTNRYYKLLVGIFIMIGIILVSLFTRGYWIA